MTPYLHAPDDIRFPLSAIPSVASCIMYFFIFKIKYLFHVSFYTSWERSLCPGCR